MRGSRAATLKLRFFDRPVALGPSLLWLETNGVLIAVCKRRDFLNLWDASAIVESHYDEQTVGCAGNTGGSGQGHRAGASQAGSLSTGSFSGKKMEVDNWMYTGDVNILDNLIAVPMRLYDISSIHGRPEKDGGKTLA
ncbi:unnamed protein product [Sphagnum troendelagicum]|uniref:Uncharacterized protein n=1 Tax=Sphagnum troendelagicum TaxID=128251 RepID=A0ABP0TN73_9BRYO